MQKAESKTTEYPMTDIVMLNKRLQDLRKKYSDAQKHVDELLKQQSVEGGWVIEGAWSPTSAPEYWRFSGLFSIDNLQATRFARKIDAECMAANMLDGINTRVAYHEWG